MLVDQDTTKEEKGAMQEFIARHKDQIIGTLSGFDRLVFRGTLRSIAYPDGMQSYLRSNGILLKDFGPHAERVSADIKKASLSHAETLGRPVQYLSSSATSKEEQARQIASNDEVREGLIAVLTCVEPCKTFDIYRNRQEKKLELVARERKCLFLYHYWLDPVFGFMNARIQTWFPFPIQVCLNGREWLARQMDGQGMKYLAAGNCFPWIEQWDRAQQLMDTQLQTEWPKVLDRIAGQLNPIHETVFQKHPVRYYWSTYQHEWAIDVAFRDANYLRQLYPRLIHHGITTFGSTDVLRYLGKRTPLSGEVARNFAGEVTATLKEREEGVRIKHVVNNNSLKLYDKAFTAAGSTLRAETTLQNTQDLRVYRPKEGDPDGPSSWRPMRRGIADLYRRAELSKKATERYLDAYASIEDSTTFEQLIVRIEKPTTWRGRRVRPLRPFNDDRPLLAAIACAQFELTGFRNRNLQELLFSAAPSSGREARRRSAWVSRQLRLLRAHGLITKINGTHRYRLTRVGRTMTTAILTALRATVRQLMPEAA
jgi:hypothetical protein